MAELFKYKTISDYTIYSLANKYLYFSKPSELDDIFECKICPDFSNTTNQEIQNWINLQLTNGATNFPYKTVPDVRNAIANGELEKNYINNKKIIEHYHILSLCKEKDNQKLWSLYGDTYKGICIGYSVNSNPNSEYGLKVFSPSKTYSVGFPLANFKLIDPTFDEAIFKPTQYNNEGQYTYNWINEKFFETSNGQQTLKYDGLLNPQNDRSKIFNTILNSKSQIWSEQNEYRAFYNDLGKTGCKVYYPDESLSSIIFGFNVPEKKKKDIYNLMKNNYSNFASINFETAEPDYTTRKIKFTTYRP